LRQPHSDGTVGNHHGAQCLGRFGQLAQCFGVHGYRQGGRLPGNTRVSQVLQRECEQLPASSNSSEGAVTEWHSSHSAAAYRDVLHQGRICGNEGGRREQFERAARDGYGRPRICHRNQRLGSFSLYVDGDVGIGSQALTGNVLFADASNSGLALGTAALGAGTKMQVFNPLTLTGTGSEPIPLVIGDFNRNGYPDITVSNINATNGSSHHV
jgi:hypothetical protein